MPKRRSRVSEISYENISPSKNSAYIKWQLEKFSGSTDDLSPIRDLWQFELDRLLRILKEIGDPNLAFNIMGSDLKVGVDPDGNTPLLWSINNGFTEFTNLLISRDAYVNVANRNGIKPFKLAQNIGDSDLCRALTRLDNLTTKDMDELISLGNWSLIDNALHKNNRYFDHALYCAVLTGKEEVVSNLVRDRKKYSDIFRPGMTPTSYNDVVLTNPIFIRAVVKHKALFTEGYENWSLLKCLEACLNLNLQKEFKSIFEMNRDIISKNQVEKLLKQSAVDDRRDVRDLLFRECPEPAKPTSILVKRAFKDRFGWPVCIVIRDNILSNAIDRGDQKFVNNLIENHRDKLSPQCLSIALLRAVKKLDVENVDKFLRLGAEVVNYVWDYEGLLGIKQHTLKPEDMLPLFVVSKRSNKSQISEMLHKVTDRKDKMLLQSPSFAVPRTITTSDNIFSWD